MVKKFYPHIKLPNQFIGGENIFTVKRMLIPEPITIDRNQQKKILKDGIISIQNSFQKKKEKILLDTDKKIHEIKVSFYHPYTSTFVNKYGIEVYSYQEEELYGSISTEKLPGQDKSKFDVLKEDIDKYITNNSQISFLGDIKDFSALTYEDIVSEEILEYKFKEHEKIMVDISFEGKRSEIQQKLDIIHTRFPDQVFGDINTDLVHFCRLTADKKDISFIATSFAGVCKISNSPIYNYMSSAISSEVSSSLTIEPVAEDVTPLFLFDTAINNEHIYLKGATVSTTETCVEWDHGTGVASLMIYGTKITKTGTVRQDNKIIHTDVMNSGRGLEFLIKKTIEDYKDHYPIIIANLSINEYGNGQTFYTRSNINTLTILLDELSNLYNCLFTISIGNLFGVNGWNIDMTKHAMHIGYPNLFHLPFSRILPPSDSINNISVGSIAKGHTTDSLGLINHPSLITRNNIKGNIFKKPDLVNYDGNGYIDTSTSQIEIEEIGPLIADAKGNNKVTRSLGTSLTAPLYCHHAGILHNTYKEYSNNSIKGLLIHFAEKPDCYDIGDKELVNNLIGYGVTNMDKALQSLNTAVTIVIESEIGMDKQIRITLPIPKTLAGSSRKRFRVRKTLVYNPIVNHKYPDKYNPIELGVRIVKGGTKITGTISTKGKESNAYLKSNVKSYAPEDFSTNKYFSNNWELLVTSHIDNDFYIHNNLRDYKQKFSIIVTMEDIDEDDTLDLYADIDTQINLPIEIPAT